MTKKDAPPRERGAIVKKWRGRTPVCVLFPNSYHMGMSNLAVHMLYRTMNAMDDVVCERCFFEDDGRVLSVESGRPLSSFEVIFVTLSFELDYINIPKILTLSAIPVSSEERKQGDPLVVAGGITVTANPEPVHAFFDLFLMGDIEEVIPGFMDTLRDLQGRPRRTVIDGLRSFDFVYDPAEMEPSYGEDGTIRSFTPPGFSVKVARHKGRTLGTSAIITDRAEFADMFLVEGTRGCPSRCPFCLLGNSYGFTHDDASPFTATEEHVGLIGGGVSFHPRLVETLTRLKEMGKTPHLPSLRMDEVPLSVIDLIKDDVKTLTFGIEAGTERLRRSIGKPLTDKEIHDKAEAILSLKSFNLKLYFMVGLYGESMEDVDAIGDLVKHVRHLMLKAGAPRGVMGSITVHVSPFVPKPATPFQWLPMDDTATLKEKVGRLRKIFGKVDNTFFTHESVKHSVLQGILARGDRRVKGAILKLARGENLTRVLRESPVNPDFFILRERGEDEVFPWDFIKGPVRKETLRKRLGVSRKALEGEG